MAKPSTKESKQLHIQFDIKETKTLEDDKYFIFSGWASTFGNVDLDGDIIEKGAFKDSIDKIISSGDNLPVLWQHSMNTPLGIYTEFREEDKGLFVKGKLPKEDSFVSERVIPQLKVGSVRKMSIGFFIKDSEFITKDDKTVRLIKNVELFEVSLVTIPANNKADITEMKAATPFQDLPLAPRDKEWSKEDALGRVRTLTGSTEEPSTKYKSAFFWFDENNEELFGSYKLPFADVVDGALHAVPRAIFAVAAALRGARGGVNIPDADREKIIANVNKYYSKMRREFDDESITSPFEEGKSIALEDFTSYKEIETYIKSYGISNKQAKTVISKIKEISRTSRDAEETKEGRDDTEDIKCIAGLLEQYKQLI